MSSLLYDDRFLSDVLKSVKVIAMVGASAKWNRPSNFAMKYLQGKGYRVIPVNPGLAGGEILGETVYENLASIPFGYQMVDIFRNSTAAGEISDEAIALKDEKKIEVVWMQLGVQHNEAAQRAEEAGLKVVMDRCPKIEYGRLFGELSWAGINSGIITSKRLKR
ncbi:MAG: CoA-binding protein [Methylocystaceae bacterium]|nr:CoA-binding protein [Methylocystaceae bacterium]